MRAAPQGICCLGVYFCQHLYTLVSPHVRESRETSEAHEVGMLYVVSRLAFPNSIDLSVIASLVVSKTSIYNWKHIRNIHSSCRISAS